MGSPSTITVILHERIGTWSRQLRTRLSGGPPLAWVETRSAADLDRALRGVVAAVVLVDLADDPAARLADLARVRPLSADPLVLVLDPQTRPGASLLARELGATRVLSGMVPPPEVAALLADWVRLVSHRRRGAGWPARPVQIDHADPGLASFGISTARPDRAAPAPAFSPRNPA